VPQYSQAMSKHIHLGTRAAVEKRVEFRHTLTARWPALPPVLSTPRMIDWMEVAGYQAMLPFCEDDEVSVGTAINISHRVPAGVGTLVRCEAVLESVEGRFLTFRVTAQAGGVVLGAGTIGRTFVSKAKFAGKFPAQESAP
jgi:fluoroacetyl-CoA thioesterase